MPGWTPHLRAFSPVRNGFTSGGMPGFDRETSRTVSKRAIHSGFFFLFSHAFTCQSILYSSVSHKTTLHPKHRCSRGDTFEICHLKMQDLIKFTKWSPQNFQTYFRHSVISDICSVKYCSGYCCYRYFVDEIIPVLLFQVMMQKHSRQMSYSLYISALAGSDTTLLILGKCAKISVTIGSVIISYQNIMWLYVQMIFRECAFALLLLVRYPMWLTTVNRSQKQ